MTHIPFMTAGWPRARSGAGAFVRVALLTVLLLSGLGGLATTSTSSAHAYEWCDMC
jgi:hypothetical protein